MVHSVELLFDAGTEVAVREVWDELARNGVRSLSGHRSPTNRPHVTLTVATKIDAGADDALRPLLRAFPLSCVIGAPMVFGGGRTVTLVRLLVPSRELLGLHAEVHRVCLPHASEGVLPHSDPGRWTPHVTLARRVPVERLPAVFALRALSRDIEATAVGLRRWNGDDRVEHRI
ncbi:2'-5' RNA ligase family protein [Mycobacterium sp. 4D054]|uniref:2'-5' RNA ligase family protein n=1 Tax=Mycobacterium sp. 4D054 TaxID=3457440 RepID=UPI003FD6165D